MKVSLSWLSEYVNIELKANVLADALTMAGLEVETVSDRYDYLNRVVVGRVAEIRPHPKNDVLKLCRVETGGRTISVVCGAPNTQEDMLAPCALPGTVLPNGTVLEKSLIREEVSEGMLCSEIELGLGAESAGIMELSRNLSIGDPLNQALGLSDKVFEIDLTPNRPDCLSVIGIAREIAAIQKTHLKYPEIRLPESSDDIYQYTSVSINDPELCPRYAASLIVDITVEPSPFWLQDRLISVGLKPINNIVDITNFVMMETGQPLHAFDLDHLAENRIVVRAAGKDGSFITLDGKERRLDAEMLMICDGQKPVAIGGVMGGLNSEVEDATTRILLESAYFNPVSIRKTSKKLGLSTDASHRFERGVDPDGAVRALQRATLLIADIGKGKRVKGVIDEHPIPASKKTIILSAKALNRHLGTRLNLTEIESHLKSIEVEVEKIDDDKLQVVPPSCRVDISRFEDLSEEIARLYGYNNIETTFPLIPAESRPDSGKIASRGTAKRLMVGLGFTEAINYSFISELSGDRLELEPDDPKRNTAGILNPLSEDQSVMRTSLIPGLLETMHYNLSMQNYSIKLFEIGNVFFNTGKKDAQPDEIEMFAGLWTGNRVDAAWFSKEIHCDFYDLKGVVEELIRNLGGISATFTRIPPESCLFTNPGASSHIIVENKGLGFIGEVHPAVLRNYNLKQKTFIFELNFDQLIAYCSGDKATQPLPKFPATSRDVTLIVDTDIETYHILKSVENLNEKLIEDIHLFAVFQGDPVPVGKKSVSFRITYRSSAETLEDNTVNHLHMQIADKVVKKFNATLPSL